MISINPPVRSPSVLAPAVLGALLCFALLLLFGALAAGIGLVSFKLERGQVPQASVQWLGGIYCLFALIISFFVGGFASSRFARADSRATSIWCGLGSWSVVVVSFALLIGSFATSISSLLVEAGVGAGAAAGAAGSIDEITGQLSKVRIVTDLKVFKGKAITQIVVPKRGTELAGVAAQEAPREIKSAQKKLEPSAKTKTEVQQVAGTARSVVGNLSLALVLTLIVGALASASGGWFAQYYSVLGYRP